jgi:hypothetical protein
LALLVQSVLAVKAFVTSMMHEADKLVVVTNTADNFVLVVMPSSLKCSKPVRNASKEENAQPL